MSLLVTVGCPGAGKSTWADINVHPSALRLERDRFRECIFGSRRNYHSSIFEPDQKSAVVTQAMLSAMFYWPTPEWAVTDTGLYEKSVAPFIDFANRVCVPIKLFIFDRPFDLLRERNETRPVEHRVPADVLEQCYDKFIAADAWWRTSMYEREFV